MPIYEYQCPQGHKHERLRPMSESSLVSVCRVCGHLAQRIMSLTHWFMGYEFLKSKSEKSPPAPTDSGYYPEWDEAYAPQ